ncbi:MAG: hypothetical protein ACXQTV_01445 [Candidatus Hecatellaceae archaeon]
MTVSVRELKHLAPRPQTLKCRCFIDDSGFRRTITVILSPIRLRIRRDGVDISWGCSCGEKCRNQNCRYSNKGEPLQHLLAKEVWNPSER